MFLNYDIIETFKIGNLINQDLINEDPSMSKYLFSLHLENHWKKIVGEYIFDKTQISYKENGILRVYSEYSSIKTEIFLRKEILISQLNELVQRDVIKNIEVM